MDNDNRKEKLIGLLGTLLVHGVLLLLMWFLFIRASEPQVESGVPVLLGTEMLAQGEGDRYKMTEVDILPSAEKISAPPEKNISQVGEEIISQDMEETVSIEQKKKARTEGRDGFDKNGASIFMSISGRLPNDATLPGYRGKYFNIGLGVDPQLMPETYEYLVKNVGAEY